MHGLVEVGERAQRDTEQVPFGLQSEIFASNTEHKRADCSGVRG
jgi:hypothetical protein